MVLPVNESFKFQHSFCFKTWIITILTKSVLVWKVLFYGFALIRLFIQRNHGFWFWRQTLHCFIPFVITRGWNIILKLKRKPYSLEIRRTINNWDFGLTERMMLVVLFYFLYAFKYVLVLGFQLLNRSYTFRSWILIWL